MCAHAHTHAKGIHTFVLYVHKMPKQASQPGSWLQPLPICVLQIGIWIKWSLRCPEGGKRRQSLTWPDLLPEQTFKMRINFGVGVGGVVVVVEGKKRQRNPLPLFSETRRISKQGVKTGTGTSVQAHTNTHKKALPCQCTICNINVWK